MTGRRVAAAEADRIGLATAVVPAAELDGAVADLTAGAARRRPRTRSSRSRRCSPAPPARRYAEQDRAEREAQTRRLRDLAGLGE